MNSSTTLKDLLWNGTVSVRLVLSQDEARNFVDYDYYVSTRTVCITAPTLLTHTDQCAPNVVFAPTSCTCTTLFQTVSTMQEGCRCS